MLNRRQELLETLRKKSADKQAKRAQVNTEEKHRKTRCFRLFRPAATPDSRCFVVGLSVAAHAKPSATQNPTPLDRFVHHRLFEPWLVSEICRFLAPDKIRRWSFEPTQSGSHLIAVVTDVAIDEASNRIFIARTKGHHSRISTYDFNGDSLQTFWICDTQIIRMCVDPARHEVLLHTIGELANPRMPLVRRFRKKWTGHSPEVEVLFEDTSNVAGSMCVHPTADLIYMAQEAGVRVLSFKGERLASLQGKSCVLYAKHNILWTYENPARGFHAYDPVSFEPLAHFSLPPPLAGSAPTFRLDLDNLFLFATSNRVYILAESNPPCELVKKLSGTRYYTEYYTEGHGYYAIDITDTESRQTATHLSLCNDKAQMNALCGCPTLHQLADLALGLCFCRVVVHSTLHFAIACDFLNNTIYVMAPGWADLE